MSKINFAVAYVMTAVTARPKREEGASAVEYALIVAGIAILLLGAVTVFGGQLRDFFNGLGGRIGITTAPTGGGGGA